MRRLLILAPRTSKKFYGRFQSLAITASAFVYQRLIHGYFSEACDTDSFNRDWQVVDVHHVGEQPQALEEDSISSSESGGMTRYVNQVTLMPGDAPWRATPNPKPRVDGPQVAFVVGPEGEEIHCDEHGRVKVQFPWDRYAEPNDTASCWVRVAQGWAGGGYGSIAIPRIGHEVIVSFLEGDPPISRW